VYRHAIQLELTAVPVDLHAVRSLYDRALRAFGQKDIGATSRESVCVVYGTLVSDSVASLQQPDVLVFVDLWLELLRFELKSGDITRVS
jgi:hypothetical protein